MMNKYLCIFLSVVLLSSPLLAQTVSDQASQENKPMTLPYKDWYSFEEPDEGYTKKFLKSAIAPAALAGIGLLIQANEPFKHELQTHLDWNKDWRVPMFEDELRWTPYYVGFLLPVFDVYPKHKGLHAIPLAIGAYVLADRTVHHLKYATDIQRPNEKLHHLYNSFPSQHTSMSFVAATILHHEYGHYSPWISVGAYAVATWVGYTRVAQSYHWTSDVLVGAAIGTFSTNLVYWAYDGLSDWICSKNQNQSLSFTPYFDGQHAVFSMNYQF